MKTWALKMPKMTTMTTIISTTFPRKTSDVCLGPICFEGKFSVIIICKEYEFLRELLEKEDGPYIVTGHPGTGS